MHERRKRKEREARDRTEEKTMVGRGRSEGDNAMADEKEREGEAVREGGMAGRLAPFLSRGPCLLRITICTGTSVIPKPRVERERRVPV